MIWIALSIVFLGLCVIFAAAIINDSLEYIGKMIRGRLTGTNEKGY